MIPLPDAAATEAAGAALAPILRAGDVVTLEGPLGAGKTSLARGVLRGLGLAGEAPSPSFALVIAYQPPETRLPVAHVDLYRIEVPDEADELGLDDYRDDGVLLVEWPSRLPHTRWTGALQLTLAADGDGRRLTWLAGAGWEGRWPPR